MTMRIRKDLRQLRKDIDQEKFANGKIAKFLAVMMVVLFAINLYAQYQRLFDTSQPILGGPWVWVRIDYATGIIMILLVMLLTGLQGGIYWGARKYKDIDERQLRQRQEIMDTSYTIGMILTFIGLIAISYLLPKINQLNTTDQSLLSISITPIMFFAYSLPMIVAAWKKKRP